jgi:hypothetical protein
MLLSTLPAFLSAKENPVKKNQDVQVPLKKLEKIQKYVGSMSTEVTDPNCENCSQEKLFYQCVEDVCSKSKIHTNAADLSEQALKDLPNRLKDPKIKSIHEALKKSLKELLLSNIENYSNRLDTTKKLLNNLDFSKDKDRIQFSVVIDLLNLGIQGDTKSLPAYFQLQLEKIEAASKGLVIKNYNFNSDNPKIPYGTQYPGIERSVALKNDIKKFEMAMKDVLASDLVKFDPSIKTNIESFYKSKFYKDANSGKAVSDVDIKDMLKTLSFYSVELAILKDMKLTGIRKNLDISKIKQTIRSKEMGLKLETASTELDHLKNDSKGLNAINLCSDSLVAAYLNLPPKGINVTLEKMGERLKHKMLKTVFPKFSKESQSYLRPLLKRWNFETKNAQDFLTDLNSDITKRSALNKSKKYSFSSVGLPLLNFSTDNSVFLFTQILPSFNTVCNVMLPTPGGSITDPLSDKIHTGWGTFKDLNAGDALLSHELGHLLSFNIKVTKLSKKTKKMYEKMMTCLDKKHGSTNSQLAEEDFADFISATMEGPKGNNVGCFLKQNYSEDPIKDHSELDHPQNFYRLLNVENIMRKNIPKTCQKFLENSPTKMDLTSCWSEAVN